MSLTHFEMRLKSNKHLSGLWTLEKDWGEQENLKAPLGNFIESYLRRETPIF